MEEIDRERIKAGFLAYWKMILRNGMIDQANNLAKLYNNDPNQNPTNTNFICWALTNRYFDPKQDPEVVWEKQAAAYLEQQIRLEESYRN